MAPLWRSRRGRIAVPALFAACFVVTVLNFLSVPARRQTTLESSPPPPLATDVEDTFVAPVAVVVDTPHSRVGRNAQSRHGATETPTSTRPPPLTSASLVPQQRTSNAPDSEGLAAKDPRVSPLAYGEALTRYQDNLKIVLPKPADQTTKDFVDVNELPDHGVFLPHEDLPPPLSQLWKACDTRNTTFSVERDRTCAQYLMDVNNMRSIKAMSSFLKMGRTIKFRIYYRHNNLSAIVKVSQEKFFFEPASEYLAYSVDRVLNFSRVPPTAWVALPVDYMRAASAALSPFFCQWFDKFIVRYDYTKENLFSLRNDPRDFANVTIQLWMSDVHSALMSTLALPYDFDDRFVQKYYNAKHHGHPTPIRQAAVSDLLDRFIFDFIIGNTDRGMNDHNNFVFGGCTKTTECEPPPEDEKTFGPAKYAFIDHGSSFHSQKEPEENPFTGNVSDIRICRYRRSTYLSLRSFLGHEHGHKTPFIDAVRRMLPKGIFNIVRHRVFNMIQPRLEKIVSIIQGCIDAHGEDAVLSLPEVGASETNSSAQETQPSSEPHSHHHRRHTRNK